MWSKWHNFSRLRKITAMYSLSFRAYRLLVQWICSGVYIISAGLLFEPLSFWLHGLSANINPPHGAHAAG